MAFLTNTGIDAAGNKVFIPVASPVIITQIPLAANDLWDSGIMYYNGATTVDYQIFSDVAGAVTIKFYTEAGELLPFTPNPALYNPTIVQSFQSAFNAKGYACSFHYLNGNTAQTVFMLGISFGQSSQETQQSTVTAISDTSKASVVKSTHQGKENGTGTRKEVTTTSVGSKIGSDVYIVNPTAMAITSEDFINLKNSVDTLSTEDTLSSLLEAFNAEDFATNSTITTLIGAFASKDFATQTTLLAILTKLNSSIATTGTSSISGNVEINNFPSTQQVEGTVTILSIPSIEISNDVGNAIPIQGTITISNFLETQIVSGAVSITGIPTVEITNDSGSPISISGSVNIGNLPSIQTINGTVAISNYPNSQAVSGSVAISNFPSTQTVTGTITINSIPAGTNLIGAVNVNNSLNISNFPSVQPISDNNGSITVDGTISFSNTTINIGNFPASQTISATSLPLPTGASTSANQSLTNAGIGAVTDTYITDPTTSASIIALLKGLLYETPGQATASSTTTINLVANTSTTIAAVNTLRKGMSIFSTSGTILILYGTGASTTLYSTRIITNGYCELPFYYSGIVTAYATSASSINVTILS